MKLTNQQVLQRCRDRFMEVRAEAQLRREIEERERPAGDGPAVRVTDGPDMPGNLPPSASPPPEPPG